MNSREELENNILKSLDKDIPPIMMVGISGATPYMYDGETEMSNTMKTHFVTITGLKVDEISGVTTATISTWSEKAYIDFAGFMEAPGLAGGVAIAS